VSVPLSNLSNVNSYKLKDHTVNEQSATIKPEVAKEVAKKSPPKSPELLKKVGIFGLNTLVSLGLSGHILRSTDKVMTHRLAIQDIATNTFIAGMSVFDPKVSANQLLESVKETTCFATPTLLALPAIATRFPNFLGIMGAAITAPTLAETGMWGVKKLSENMNKNSQKDASNNITENDTNTYLREKNADPKVKDQKNEVLKTHIAVGLSGAMKAYSLASHIKTDTQNDHVASAILTSTLLNTLKTSYTTNQAYKNGEVLREAKNVAPILFDGAVSSLIAGGIHSYADKHNWKQDPMNIVGQSIIGGLLSSGVLYGIRQTLNPILDTALGIKETSTLEDNQDADTILNENITQKPLPAISAT